MGRKHAPAVPDTSTLLVESVFRQAKGVVRSCDRWFQQYRGHPDSETVRLMATKATELARSCEDWLRSHTGSTALSHERKAS